MKQLKFDIETVKFLKSIGARVNDDGMYTDDEIIEMEDIVSDHLTMHGFEFDYSPNDIAQKCYAVIDYLAES